MIMESEGTGSKIALFREALDKELLEAQIRGN